MKADFFIAKRIAFDPKGSNSQWIIKIAIVAIALCMTVMIVASSLIRGFKTEISDKVFGFWGHINITNTMIRTTQDDVPITIDQELLESLRSVQNAPVYRDRTFLGIPISEEAIETETYAGVRHVQTYTLKPGIIKDNTDLEGIVLKGVDDTFDWERFRRFLVEGELLQDSDTTLSRDILISKTTSNRIRAGVGDRMVIHFLRENNTVARRFNVVGIYDTNLEEYDQKFALADMDMLRPLLNFEKNEVSGIEVFIEDTRDLTDLRNHIYVNILPANLFPSTVKEKDPAIFEWLELQNYNEVVIIALMVIVSIINMITAILILILERTNMIGVLKALGQSNWGIRKIFLYQAAVIIGKGLLIGNIVGLFICLLQKYTSFIQLDEAEYYLSVAPIEINPVMIITLNLGTLGVILLALIIPSYFISNISPIKAIQFK